MNSDVPALLFDKVHARATNGALILRAVDLAVPQRGLFGIVGPNGAGKSSLLRAVIGLLPLDAGHLSIAGRVLSDWTPRELARVIGYMPQKVYSHWDLRVAEILQLASSHPVAELLDRLELDPLLDRSFNDLSGGEQARVAIARALSHQPDILLADEPVAHLDLPHQHELMQHLRDFSASRTIVIVLHDFHLASRYCDQVAMISGGTIRRCGKPRDVLSATFLSEIYGKPVDTIGEGARHFFTIRT